MKSYISMMILRYESVIFGAAVHPPQIQPQKIGLLNNKYILKIAVTYTHTMVNKNLLVVS